MEQRADGCCQSAEESQEAGPADLSTLESAKVSNAGSQMGSSFPHETSVPRSGSRGARALDEESGVFEITAWDSDMSLHLWGPQYYGW